MSTSRRQSEAEEDEDVVEMKKAMATGTKEAPSVSACELHVSFVEGTRSDCCTAVAPIICYCIASILMTVVNKVCTLVCFRSALTSRVVRSVRPQFQHELPATVHTIYRLRLVRGPRENAWDNLVQSLRYEGRQGVVPDQLPPC